MPMQCINYHTVLTPELVELGAFDAEPFGLIDVGASGGVDDIWDLFRNKRRVFAFEPLVHEAAHLQKANKDPDLTYTCALADLFWIEPSWLLLGVRR